MNIVEDPLRRTGLLAVAILGLTTAAMAQDTAARLKELQSLYDQKLITETEFQSRRQGLLDAIAPAMAPAGNGGIVPPHLGGSPVSVKAFDLKDVQGKWKGQDKFWSLTLTVDRQRLTGTAECTIGGTAILTGKVGADGVVDAVIQGGNFAQRSVRGTFPKLIAEPSGSCGGFDVLLSQG